MSLEIIFKNGIFFSLFLSMLSFWSKSFQSENSFHLGGSQHDLSSSDQDITEEGPFDSFSVPVGPLLVGSAFKTEDPRFLWQPDDQVLGQGKKLLKFFNSVGLNFNQLKPEHFFLLSFFFITSELLFRWASSGHPPLSNLYESLLFFIWGLIGFFIFWDFKRSSSDGGNPNTSIARNPFLDKQELQRTGTHPDEARRLFSLKREEASDSVIAELRTGDVISRSPEGVTVLADEYLPKLDSNQTFSNQNFSKSEFSLRNFLGGILSSTALFIETFADWRLPSEMKEMKPLIPALQSNWLLMHVSIMILSYAALLIGCLLAISYIALSSNAPEVEFKTALVDRRSLFLSDLDSLSFRVLAFGFPLLTLGILSGAVWANEAWGSYWSWDPKETWAFITWLIFAFYLHTRLQYGWEGKKSAFVATFGFFILWICYLGVNLLGKGLHSYGWIS